MKKILALVLAVAMLSVSAFAATALTNGATGISVNPGATLTIAPSEFSDDNNNILFPLGAIGYRFNTENFTLTTQKFEKGAALVASVKLDDGDNVVKIALKDNYELARPAAGKGANLVIKQISVKAKKNFFEGTYDQSGEFKKGNSYSFAPANSATIPTVEVMVGYVMQDVALDNSPAYFTDDRMAKFKAANDVVYETVSYSTGDVYIEGRVYDGDKVFITSDYDVNKDVLKANPDAAIRFVNIKTSGLPTSNLLQLNAEEKEFVYKIVDGKLVESGLKWSASDYTWNGKIRSSTSFVISDIKLNAVAAGDATVANPNTGR